METSARAVAASLMLRAFRAARLDRRVYQEVAKDQGATYQAFAIVILAALGTGIGGLDDGGFTSLKGFPGLFVLYIIGRMMGFDIPRNYIVLQFGKPLS